MTAKKQGTPRKGSSKTGSSLRKKAEAALHNRPEWNEDATSSPPEDWRSLLHELRVHQIELEMQNEQLRQAHSELESARDRYLALYDFSPVGYLTLVQPGVIHEANLTVAKMLGIPRGELIGTALSNFVDPGDQDPYFHYLEALFGPVSRGTLEVRLVKSDNRQFYARLEASTRDAEDAIQLVISDVTDRTKAEQALEQMNATLEHRVAERTTELRESEQMYSAIFDNSPFALALMRMPGGAIISVNDAFLELFENTKEEVIGKTSLDLGIADTNSPAHITDELLAHGSVKNFEFTRFTKSGARSVLSLSLNNVMIGGTEHILTTLRDITRRKQAEQALRQAHDELELRIQERTKELATTNRELTNEVAERKKAEEGIRKEALLAEGLAQSVIALSSSLELDLVFTTILEQIERAIPSRLANITIIEGDNLRVVRHLSQQGSPDMTGVMATGYSLEDFPVLQKVYVTQQPVLVEDVCASPDWRVVPEMAWVRSFCAAPLVIEGRVIGLINLNGDHPSAFNQETMERLMAFAAPAALAVRNAEFYAAETHARQVAEAISAMSMALTQTTDLDVFLHTILEYLPRLVSFVGAYIVTLDEEANLKLRVTAGYVNEIDPKRGDGSTFQSWEIPYIHEVITTKKCLLIRDTRNYPGWEPLIARSEIRSWMGIPILLGDKVLGIVGLVHTRPESFSEEQLHFLESIAAQVSVVIQNAWLFEQVRAGQARFQSLSRRLVEVQESERRYIARELHDETNQSLAAIMFGLRSIEQEIDHPQMLGERVAEVKRLADEVQESLHRLAMNLRPASLDHLGLVPALEQLIKDVAVRYQLNIRFKSELPRLAERLPDHIETALYRIIQEALTNAGRHAHANNVDVILDSRDGKVLAMVEDDGIGFDPTEMRESDKLGLVGMQERAKTMGGSLQIESRPGGGTTIVAEVGL